MSNYYIRYNALVRDKAVALRLQIAQPSTEGELPAPNGRWIARIDDGDLWLRSTEDWRPERVTSDGTANDAPVPKG